MNSQSVLAGLFSRITVVLLFSVVGVLLSASFYTYLQDRKLQSVSLSALRMASWNLVRLGSEASALDRELSLLDRGVGEPGVVPDAPASSSWGGGAVHVDGKAVEEPSAGSASSDGGAVVGGAS